MASAPEIPANQNCNSANRSPLLPLQLPPRAISRAHASGSVFPLIAEDREQNTFSLGEASSRSLRTSRLQSSRKYLNCGTGDHHCRGPSGWEHCFVYIPKPNRYFSSSELIPNEEQSRFAAAI